MDEQHTIDHPPSQTVRFHPEADIWRYARQRGITFNQARKAIEEGRARTKKRPHKPKPVRVSTNEGTR